MRKRTLAEFEPLLAGEKTLLAGLSSGETVEIGGTTVPDESAGEARQVRGDFLRYLLLRGCDGLEKYNAYVHEKGVRLAGALITGVLDLEGCRIPRDIGLVNCRILQAPVLRSAKIDNLFLNGSVLPGMFADRLEAKGGVFLQDAKANGALRLVGAKLGGDLDCDGAQLTAGKYGVALFVDRAQIEGAFFLRNSLHNKARIDGVLDLTAAKFGAIVDEAECWPQVGNLILDRCQYGAFTGLAPVTAGARIKWLSLQDPARFGQDFWPQPWEQCAKVLREMGHGDDARAVLIDKEKRQRVDRRKGYWFGWRWLRRFMDFLLWAMVAYGHKPRRAFYWLVAFWFIGIGVFSMAAQHDAIKPNDVRIIRSDEWVACAPKYAAAYEKKEEIDLPKPRNKTGTSQLSCFLAQPEAKSYPRFNSMIYSADTLLPIVAMEMQSYWIPDDSNRGVGKWARRYLWLQIISGWGLSLLAVAGFSGLIKSD